MSLQKASLCPDATRGVYGLSGAGVVVFDAKSGKALNTLGKGPREGYSLRGDGKRLAIASVEGLEIWNVDTGALLRRVPCEPMARLPMAWSPDGRTLYASVGGAVEPVDLGE